MNISLSLKSGVVLVSSILAVCACSGNRSLSFDEAGGERFQFCSPITAIKDAGDSLLVAMGNGSIAYFNTRTGQSDNLLDLDCGTVYDMVVKDRFLYCGVRDGGIWRIDCGDGKASPEIFRIKMKGSEYSPYRMLLGMDGKELFSATSNGFYRWDADRPKKEETAVMALGRAEPQRFYSVVSENNGDVFFAGMPGVFRFDGESVDTLCTEQTLCMGDGYRLTADYRLVKGYGDTKGTTIHFKRSPRNFVAVGDYVYAISERAVECADVSGKTMTAIEFPENNRAEMNESRRAVCLVKDGFLYVAPGGSFLYRIPLAPYNRSEDVVSICEDGGRGIYALSACNDLYAVSLRQEGEVTNFDTPRYVRTVMAGRSARLLGASGDTVYVYSSGSIYRLVGKRKITEIPTHHPDSAGKVTCSLWTGKHIYQGRPDMIRRYDCTRSSDSREYVFESGIHAREGIRDYYPTKMAMVGGDTLVMGTLHSGVYFMNVGNPAHHFDCLVDTLCPSRVLAVESVGTTAFVLTRDSLYRFSLRDPRVTRSQWPVGCFGRNPSRFNRILPVSSDMFCMFSDDNIFCRGVFSYTLGDNCLWEMGPAMDLPYFVKDALLLESSDTPVFCGSNGLSVGNGGNAMAVTRPKLFWLRKLDAETFWYGRLIAVLGALLLLFLVYKVANLVSHIISRIRENSRRAEELAERQKFDETASEFRKWVSGHGYRGSYVGLLSEELISMSSGLRELRANVAAFMNEGEKLKALDRIGRIICEADRIVDREAKDADIEAIPGRNEFMNDYAEAVAEFFRHYRGESREASEWGKVFQRLEDASAPSYFKLSFLFFPLCVNNRTGEWLLNMAGTFSTRKTEWKKDDGKLHRLRNLTCTNKYSLFRLIAGAGMSNIESKGESAKDYWRDCVKN